MPQAVILAGGKGTRLASRLGGLPKPLVNVAGVPLLERQLLAIKAYGITDVLILVNHKASVIADFCQSNDNFGMNISLVDDGEPRGTAGALLAALSQLPSSVDDLLILYGDTLFNIDLDRFFRFHEVQGADGTLFLHPNDHPHDSDLVALDDAGRIQAIHPYPHPEGAEYANLVNAALYMVRRKALAPWLFLAEEPARIIDFAKELFPRMVEAGQQLFGYSSPEYIKDVGTPTRLDKAERDIASGRFGDGSLRTPTAAVFLDRDGVINQEVGHLRRKEDFSLLPGVAKAVQRLNRSGLLSVVVTNQPVLARGECSEAELAAIHARMDSFLGEAGAYVDRLYHCPHHPDKGFPGERPELKVLCTCRKPGIGMLEQAQQDLHIDFARSWFVGDRTGDLLAAKRAGVRSILVRTGAAGQDGVYPIAPDYTANDLEAACAFILDEYPAALARSGAWVEKISRGDVVLIGGLARSGKSTLASLFRDSLAERGIKAHIVSLDSFLRPIELRGSTVLERYDMEGIARFAADLTVRPCFVSLPYYQPATRKLIPDAVTAQIASDDVLIIEGVVALSSPQLRDLANHLFYLECSPEMRRTRFARDYTVRGEEKQWAALFEQREAEERPVVEDSRRYGILISAEALF